MFTYAIIVAAILFGGIGWFMADGVQKTQYVRVTDVLLYGPFLIYLSTKNTYVFTPIEKLVLLFMGVTTITYNLRNFFGNFQAGNF
jgi:hypothetical protein